MRQRIQMVPFDPFENDNDAHLSSWENLNHGGMGIWYDRTTIMFLARSAKMRQTKRVKKLTPEEQAAQADAQRDMEAESGSEPSD